MNRCFLVLSSALALLLAPVGALAMDELATITIIHGIDGRDLGAEKDLPVDVVAEPLGCVLTDFRFRDQTDRLEIPAGTYDIQVRLSDGACGGAIAVDAPGVPFAGGENATVIAHLDADGVPTASKFLNDLSPSPEGQGRGAVHHTAAAPAVDVTLFRLRPFQTLEIEDLENGEQAAADAPQSLYLAAIAPAGGTPLLYRFVWIPKGRTTSVYAVGTAGSHTLDVITDSQIQVEPKPEGTAQVKVIHGIPGRDLGPNVDPDLPVDVFVSDLGCVLKGVTFGQISDSLDVPADTYDLAISPSDGACGLEPVIEAFDVPFEDGDNLTVIAHLDELGAPTASVFENDTSRAKPLRGRLSLHHTAAAPPVDLDVVLRFFFFKRNVGGFDAVPNGASGDLDLFQSRYEVFIAPAGGDPIFSERVRVKDGTATRVYAVGSLSTGSFQLIVDTERLD